MRFAVIKNGVVSNVVLANAATTSNWVQTDVAGIGWTYVNGQFIAPQEPEPTKDQQEANRRAAYLVESDPIFFMAQRAEATTEEWAAKVNEIKARFPYPVE